MMVAATRMLQWKVRQCHSVVTSRTTATQSFTYLAEAFVPQQQSQPCVLGCLVNSSSTIERGSPTARSLLTVSTATDVVAVGSSRPVIWQLTVEPCTMLLPTALT